MFSFSNLARTIGLCIALAFALSPGRAEAWSNNLIQVAGTSDVYWVDAYGVLHSVPSSTVRRTWFGRSPVSVVEESDIIDLPRGRSITLSSGPTTTKRIVRREIIRPSRLSVDYGAAPVVYKRRVTVEEIEDLEDIEDLYEE